MQLSRRCVAAQQLWSKVWGLHGTQNHATQQYVKDFGRQSQPSGKILRSRYARHVGQNQPVLAQPHSPCVSDPQCCSSAGLQHFSRTAGQRSQGCKWKAWWMPRSHGSKISIEPGLCQLADNPSQARRPLLWFMPSSKLLQCLRGFALPAADVIRCSTKDSSALP